MREIIKSFGKIALMFSMIIFAYFIMNDAATFLGVGLMIWASSIDGKIK
jgi:hypothetical protein